MVFRGALSSLGCSQCRLHFGLLVSGVAQGALVALEPPVAQQQLVPERVVL